MDVRLLAGEIKLRKQQQGNNSLKETQVWWKSKYFQICDYVCTDSDPVENKKMVALRQESSFQWKVIAFKEYNIHITILEWKKFFRTFDFAHGTNKDTVLLYGRQEAIVRQYKPNI